MSPSTLESVGNPSTTGQLDSAVYKGIVRHRRVSPGPAHEFSYEVTMPLLYLDEIEKVAAIHPLWSARWPAPVRFRREDYLPPATVPLPDAVRDLVAHELGNRPDGRVAMLGNVRTWGWLFNPITLFYCFESHTGRVEALVAEVENTPWHERHTYVLGPAGTYRFPKGLHVSPFLPMALDYQMSFTEPGRRLSLHIDVLDGDDPCLSAGLALTRVPLTRKSLGHLLWAHGAPTVRVSAGIYAQAARLLRKGAPFYPHPARGSAPRGTSVPSCPEQIGRRPLSSDGD